MENFIHSNYEAAVASSIFDPEHLIVYQLILEGLRNGNQLTQKQYDFIMQVYQKTDDLATIQRAADFDANPTNWD